MGKLLVNLRGTSGSGKSTLVRQLIQRSGADNLKNAAGKVVGVRVHPVHETSLWRWPIFIVGKYDNACGGMDTIATQQEAADRAVKAYQHGHVICEGLLASLVGPRATLPAALIAAAGPDVRFLCLDTPLEVCLERLDRRRAEAGNTRPLRPDGTADKWRATRRAYQQLEEDEQPVFWLPYETAFEKVLRMLEIADATD